MQDKKENMKSLFEKANQSHEENFDWRAGYHAYYSDFEWDERKSEMWKMGYLYAHIHLKGGLVPQG